MLRPTAVSACVGLLIAASTFLSAPAAVGAKGQAEHVVIIVWDGMRPDFITPQYTPTLYSLARQGVFFNKHHSVFPSTTEVNGTALATGCYPNRSGIFANRVYRPDLDPCQSTGVEMLDAVRKGDTLSNGHYLRVPTVAELLQAAGARTVIAGAKRVALLHDRRLRPDAPNASVDLFEGNILPADAMQQITQALGPLPPPGTTRDDWTTQALIGPLWTPAVPRFSLLWLSEPDLSEHRIGPGTAGALAAMRGSDNNLARVLAALTAKGRRDTTDIFIVSDHGFSTTRHAIDLAAVLTQAGFTARRTYPDQPTNDNIVVVGNSGTVLLYVIGHSPAVTHRLVEFLQQQEFTGVVLTPHAQPGTFAYDQVMVNVPNPPDVIVSLRWTAEPNAAGVPGLIYADGTPPVNVGIHGSLSRFDLHNTLIAAGPDFRRGLKDDLPSGNVDVAPTILYLLGVTPTVPMDGRILREALIDAGPALTTVTRQVLEANCPFATNVWHQSLTISRFDNSSYVDEGNGVPIAK